MKKILFLALITLTLCSTFSVAQEKIEISKAEDLPKHSYALESTNALEIVQDKEKVMVIAAMIKEDIKNDLEKYDILDNSALKERYADLRMIATIEGNYEKALELIYKERELADKESEKIIRAMSAEAVLKAVIEVNSLELEKISPLIIQTLEQVMAVEDFSVIQEDVEQFKGRQEIMSENLIIGIVQGEIQQAIDNQKGEIPGNLVVRLVGMYYMLNYYIPYTQSFFTASENSIEKYGEKVVKTDIWKERDVTLESSEKIKSVVVCIWDSGVDMPIFPEKNRWTNKAEKLNGKDTDKNGFVDDVNGIGYDLDGNPVPELLEPIAHNMEDKLVYQNQIKGLMDLYANIKSEEASQLKKKISSLKPEEVDPYLEKLNLYGNYSHGTHVAGIVVKGNPDIEIMTSRITYDYKNIPSPMTTEIVESWAKAQKGAIEYMKEHNVRIANMSWSSSYEGVVYILEANGIGESDEERKKLALEYYSHLFKSMEEAMQSAPEILFIAAAGNSNDDTDFTGGYPNSINLPNIMTVGAVDIDGTKTSFTTEGASVDVYSNGYEVESYVPGGDIIAFSGTSMASPQVANLAAKILAVDPTLTPEEVIKIIIETSTKSEEDENVLLIHPKNAVAKLSKK